MEKTKLICTCPTRSTNRNARPSAKRRSRPKQISSTKKNEEKRMSLTKKQSRSPRNPSHSVQPRSRTNVKKKNQMASKSSRTKPVSADSAEAKQHEFTKPDRSESLMALHQLAEKIAEYRQHYGEIETRTSSLTEPPKRLKKTRRRQD